MHSSLLKKLRDKGAVYADGQGPPPATPSKPTATPASAKKRRTPAKKADGDQGEEHGSPSKKARKPRVKKADTPLSLKSERKLLQSGSGVRDMLLMLCSG